MKSEKFASAYKILTSFRQYFSFLLRAIANLSLFTITFYFIIPCSMKIFFSATTERSTCSLVCVAMRA